MKPNGESPFIPNEHQMEFNVLAPYTQTRIRVIRLRRKGNVPLGFSIRGGCEHGTGIFVSDIQPGTEAEHQGLKVGDQIVRINGYNIDRAIHEEVLSLLKSKPGVVLKVKSVGMIPVKDHTPNLLTDLGLLESKKKNALPRKVSRSLSTPTLFDPDFDKPGTSGFILVAKGDIDIETPAPKSSEQQPDNVSIKSTKSIKSRRSVKSTDQKVRPKSEILPAQDTNYVLNDKSLYSGEFKVNVFVEQPVNDTLEFESIGVAGDPNQSDNEKEEDKDKDSNQRVIEAVIEKVPESRRSSDEGIVMTLDKTSEISVSPVPIEEVKYNEEISEGSKTTTVVSEDAKSIQENVEKSKPTENAKSAEDISEQLKSTEEDGTKSLKDVSGEPQSSETVAKDENAIRTTSEPLLLAPAIKEETKLAKDETDEPITIEEDSEDKVSIPGEAILLDEDTNSIEDILDETKPSETLVEDTKSIKDIHDAPTKEISEDSESTQDQLKITETILEEPELEEPSNSNEAVPVLTIQQSEATAPFNYSNQDQPGLQVSLPIRGKTNSESEKINAAFDELDSILDDVNQTAPVTAPLPEKKVIETKSFVITFDDEELEFEKRLRKKIIAARSNWVENDQSDPNSVRSRAAAFQRELKRVSKIDEEKILGLKAAQEGEITKPTSNAVDDGKTSQEEKPNSIAVKNIIATFNSSSTVSSTPPVSKDHDVVETEPVVPKLSPGKKKDPLTWKMIDKNSPNGSVVDGSNSYSGSSNFEEFCEKSILISDIGAAGIGCTIVKGPPDLPGIFVQTVKPNGLAELSGLNVGDHIIDVNGVPFFEIDFKEAVAWMKSSKDLRMTVRKGAGLDLFPEEKARRVAAILNGVSHITRQEEPTSSTASTDTVATRDVDENKNDTNGTNGHTEADPKRDINHNQKECVDSGNESQNHIRQDSVSTIATNATSTPSFTTTTGSEREYCISEAEEAIAEPIVMSNGNGSIDVTDRIPISGTGTLSVEELKKEEEWLIRERKHLEEEHKKLREEAEKLAEERKKLEEDKKRQSNHQESDITPPPPMMMIPLPLAFPSVGGPASPALTKSFLAELQQKQLNPISNGDSRHSRSGSEVEKYQEEIVKRQQHEKLMQEFQQMHKRMFGAQNGESKPRSEPKPIPTVNEVCGTTPPAPSTENVTQSHQVYVKKPNPSTQCFTLNHNRRQRASEASFPPPPPPGIPRTVSQPNLEHFKIDDDREPEVFEITKDELEATQAVPVDLRRQTLVASRPLMVPPTPSTGSVSATSPPISIPSRTNGVSVPVIPSSPPTSTAMGSPLASCSPPVSPNVRQVNGKDVPITDSRGPAPKPPQTYFDRPVKGPLVTIGVYPDTSRNNRFTFHESVASANGRGGCMHPALRHRQLESISSSPTSTLSSASGGPSNKPSFSVSMTSSNSLNSSNASSTTSSPLPQQKQSSVNKEIKDISVKVNVNSISVNKSKETVIAPQPTVVANGSNHVPKMTISLNGKTNGSVNGTSKGPDVKTNGTTSANLKNVSVAGVDPKAQTTKKTDKSDPLKMFTDEQLEGRELKMIDVKKTGTLNMKVEGGINSDLNGKVVVSEVWPGGCIPNSAGICRGDQILMVNERKLINVSLTLANAVLRDAMANNKETLRLVIAKETRAK